MPRKKQPAAVESASVPKKSETAHLFVRTKDERRNALTHEQIVSDLAAFERAGGKIEVLGTTMMLKSIGTTTASVAATATVPNEGVATDTAIVAAS